MTNQNKRHKSSVALLLIDVINQFEFPDGTRLLRQALPVASRLARMKNRARHAGIPATYVNDNFGQLLCGGCLIAWLIAAARHPTKAGEIGTVLIGPPVSAQNRMTSSGRR